MSVGGIVTKVIPDGDRIWVDTEERGSSTTKCAIYVERNENSERIRPGDSLWWQGRWALWTPYDTRKSFKAKRRTGAVYDYPGKAGVDYDIKIPRRGYSGATPPSKT